MFFMYLQLLENMESKMKNTCVDGTIPKLFEGKMLVSVVIGLTYLQSLCHIRPNEHIYYLCHTQPNKHTVSIFIFKIL